MNQYISYRNILSIALPLMISGVANNLINVADTAFMGRLGEAEIGGVGNGSMFFFIFAVVGLGFSTGMEIVIGRRNGEGNFSAIGELFRTSFVFMLVTGAFMSALLYFSAPYIMNLFVADENIMDVSVRYLQGRSWAILFACMNFLFLGFFVGVAKTKAVSIGYSLAAVINVCLDYVLVFGKFGFPEMGVEGAALASIIAEGTTTVFFAVYLLAKIDHPKYEIITSLKISFDRLKRVLAIAWPLMGRNFVSLATWFIFFAIVEHIGPHELAISHIIRGAYMFMVIPIFGLSDTMSTMTSNLIGQGNEKQIFPLLKRMLILALSVSATFILIGQIFKKQILGVFTDDAQLVLDCYGTFNVISGCILVFSVAFILYKAVNGTGATKYSFFTESVSITVYIAAAYLIVFQFNGSVELTWCCEFLYFALLGFFSFIYLKSEKWKSIDTV